MMSKSSGAILLERSRQYSKQRDYTRNLYIEGSARCSKIVSPMRRKSRKGVEQFVVLFAVQVRSEERRVGKECA